MHGRTLGLAVTALLLSLPGSAVAVDCVNLQAALTGAAQDSTVTLDAGENCDGTFTGPVNTGVTLEGGGGGATFTSTAGRSLDWTNTGRVTLRNLTFTSDGAAGNGGVRMTGNVVPTIDDVVFLDNSTTSVLDDGGGLHINRTAGTDGTITVTNSRFGGPGAGTGNSSADDGGGAYIRVDVGRNTAIVLDNVDVERNTAEHHGGGLYLQGTTITINNARVSVNTVLPVPAAGAELRGGGISASAGTTTITASTIADNQLQPNLAGSTAGGAGLSSTTTEGASGGTNLTGNVFTGNAIVQPGGADDDVSEWGGGAMISGGATLRGNRWLANALGLHGGTLAQGGALYLSGGCAASKTLRNEYFLNNSVSNGATGTTLHLQSCAADLDNVTVRGSTGMAGTFALQGVGGALDVANSIVWGGSAGTSDLASVASTVRSSILCASGAPHAGTGNLCTDPLFVDASGPGLQAASPAVDAGDNSLVPAGLTTDLLGAARLLDGNADTNCTATVDMGAAERAAAACTPPAAPTPPADTTPPATPPLVTPPVITDPGQVLLCEGRSVVLIDIRRDGRFQVLRGLSKKSLAGKRVTITGDRGAGKFSAKVAADGSFTAKVPNPEDDQTSYVASYGKERSVPLKVSRNLFVVAQKKVAGGLRIVAQHSKRARAKGARATLLRQTGCGVQSAAGTAKFDKRGRVTFLLAAPTPPDTVAVYRVTTKLNNTFTLPVVVR